MAELYIFSQDDVLLTTLSESTGLVSAPFREELNRVPDTPLSFTIEADSENAQYVVEENQVVFRDKEGEYRLYVIKELDGIDNIDGPQTMAICLPAFLVELKDHIIVDRRVTNKEAQEALNVALEGTRWTGEVEVSLGLNSTNFYYMTSVDAIWNILSIWGGEFKDIVEFDEKNNIVSRKIKILQRRGADRGKRFEIDHDIEEIQRTVLSYPVTALYGRGASLEIEDDEGNHTGGYTRLIDFADVEWSKAKGDPVDKPKGQKWVGDPDALLKYGRKHNGQLLHRFGIYENGDYEDPAELLRATWQQLQEEKKPEVNYRLAVHLFDKDVSLGDTAAAIDRQFARPIEVQARVIAIEYDLVDIEGTAFVEMGQFLSAHETDVYRDIEDLKDRVNRPRPTPPITNERFPNLKPGTPTNVEAVGGFRTIQLYWDYDSSVYVSHYEVYGSQVKGFIPDSQHLLYRGRTSSFAHEVNTDEVWYYRIRAVNTHGTPGDFSEEVSASTVRIISDDILFGEDIASELRELSKTAQLLADGTIDLSMIGEDVTEEIESAKTSANDAIAQAQIGFDTAQSALTTANSATDIATTAKTIASESATQATSALTRAQTAMDEAKKKADASGVYTKTEIDKALTGYASTTVVNTLSGRVSTAETIIKQNTDAIALKASQSEVNTLTGRVNTAESNISIHAREIASKISAVDADKKYATQSSLTQTANSLTSQITAVQTNLDNVQVGGRNLLRNTDFRNGLNNWSNWGTATREVVDLNGKNWVHLSQNDSNRWRGIFQVVLSIKPSTPYTVSFIAYSQNNSVMTVGFHQRLGNTIVTQNWQTFTLANSPKKYSYTFTTTGSSIDQFSFMIGNDRSPFDIYITDIKLELGNIATDWTPAVEDMATATQFNTLQQTLDSTTSRIGNAEGSISTLQQTANSLASRITNTEGNISTLTQTANGLQTKVSNNEKNISTVTQTANALQTRMTNAEGNINTLTQTASSLQSTIKNMATQSQITQLSDAINLRVQKGDVVNQINVDTSGVLIAGHKVRITGQTIIDNGVIGTAAIANAAITRAKLGTAVIGTAQIEDGAITNAKIKDLNADKINAGAIRGIDIYGSKFRSSDGNTRLQVTGGNILLTQNNGNYVEINPTGITGFNSSKQRIFRADLQMVTSGALGTNTQNVYLAAKEGQEVRVVRIDNIPSDGEPSTYNYLPIRAERAYVNAVTKNTASGGTHLYLQPTSGTEVRVTSQTNLSAYQTFRAGSIFAEYSMYSGSESGNGVFTTTSGYVVLRSGESDKIVYLQGYEVRATKHNQTSSYVPIRASSFPTGSLAEYKTDIHVWEESALEKIRNTTIYEYRLRSELERGINRLRQGLVIGEGYNTPTGLIDGDGVEQYLMNTWNMKAIQELDSALIQTKDDVAWLKTENDYLKQKVSVLETKIKLLEEKVA